MNINEIIGLIAALIGILSFIWLLYKKKPIKRISWKKAEKSANSIANQLISNNNIPSLLLGIGRGGAIFGSMISGSIGQLPLVVIDRKYKWLESGRVEDMIFPINIPKKYLKNVLLVAGEAHSGNTMKCYYNYLKNINAKQISKAVLFLEEECPVNIKFYGIKSSQKKILMPWMFSKRYFRGDRHPIDKLKNEKSDYKIKLSLIRHAETNSGEDIFAGKNDYDLTVKGIKQALRIGHNFISKNIKIIYSSPLGRTIKTAKIVHDFIPFADFTIDNNLREMDFGDWDGLSRNKIKEKFPDEYSLWEQDPFLYPPHLAENPKAVLKRLQDFLDELLYKFSGNENIEVIAFLHKTTIRILLSFINDEQLKNYRKRKIENCQIIEIIYDSNKWILNSEN